MSDIESIKATVDQSLAIEKEGDLESWLTFFSEGAIFMPPDEMIVEGKDAVREWCRPYFEQFIIEESLSLDEIEVCGDRAFTRGINYFKFTPKEGGEAIEDHAKIVQILKRQSDNSWKFSLMIWNRDSPPK